jgi:hypothetical protein
MVEINLRVSARVIRIIAFADLINNNETAYLTNVQFLCCVVGIEGYNHKSNLTVCATLGCCRRTDSNPMPIVPQKLSQSLL